MAHSDTTAAQFAIKNTASALKRVEVLERDVNAIKQGLNSAFADLDAKVGRIEELLQTVVECVGVESVLAQLQTNRKQRDTDIQAIQEKDIKEALEGGRIVPADVIDTGTLLVLRGSKEGQVLDLQSRVQTLFDHLAPEVRELFKGKKLGDVVNTNINNTPLAYEVVGVYTIVKTPSTPEPK
jgi:hypothetical protein